MLLLLSAIFSSYSFSQAKVNEPPADYESDGCTLFPDGNYRDCCVAHDKDYYKGGSCKERRESDNRLYRCVKSKKGWKNKFLAPIMWIGVRVFGTSLLPTRFRWGFGKKKKNKEKRKMQKFNPPPPDQSRKEKPAESDPPQSNSTERDFESKRVPKGSVTLETDKTKTEEIGLDQANQ